MGACNFGGGILGVAVGMDATSYWTDEDRADYREMVEDDTLSDDYVDERLNESENDYISDVYAVTERFVEDLNRFVFWWFFQSHDIYNLLEVRINHGYHSGFEVRLVDPHGFYNERVRFVEAQAEQWADYYEKEDTLTAEEWAKHIEKAIDFIDYALVRFAYNKGLSYTIGGWTGGTSPIDADDVRAHALFDEHKSGLALLWRKFYERYGREYNRAGL